MPPSADTALRHFDYETGEKLLAERKLREALTEFQGVAAANPEHAKASFQIARLLLEGFRVREALPWFERAAELMPETRQVWQGWAEAVALGGVKSDRRAFLAAIKQAPIPADLIVALQDRFGARRKSSRPNTGGVAPDVLKRLMAGLGAGAFAKVEAQATKIMAGAPKCAIAANVMAEAQARQNKIAPAIENHRRATRIDPLYAEAYGSLGQLLARLDRRKEALGAFRAAVILAPDMVPSLIDLGKLLAEAAQYDAAIHLLTRARDLDERNASAAANLGYAQAQKGDHDAAHDAYERAVKLRGKKAPTTLLLALAQSQANVGESDKALATLDGILVREPDLVDALLSKATVFQNEGDFARAEAELRRVIALNPLNGEAYRGIMQGGKVQPDEPLITQMVEIFDRDDLPETDRMNLGFALAKALDDTGQDDRVFTYLNPANAILMERSRASMDQRFAEVAKCREIYGQVDFSAIPPAGNNALAPIFVTGLPRSGTTLVEQIIAAHSEVTSGGEIGYATGFARRLLEGLPGGGLAAADAERIAEVGRDYEAAIGRRFPGVTRLTDKSIFTFQHIGPLSLALPAARFIVVRRDPRDTLLSIYKNRFAEGTHGYGNNLESLARFYDEFDRTIAFWRKHRPESFTEVSYEALVGNPEPEARALIRAAGLEWEDGCLEFHKAKTKVQTLSVYQVRQPINAASVSGWRRFEADLAPMIDQLRKDGHVTD